MSPSALRLSVNLLVGELVAEEETVEACRGGKTSYGGGRGEPSHAITSLAGTGPAKQVILQPRGSSQSRSNVF